jgi:hypothetical protein
MCSEGINTRKSDSHVRAAPLHGMYPRLTMLTIADDGQQSMSLTTGSPA